MAQEPTNAPMMEDDPSMIRSRREAIIILSMWGCCFLYSVPYCYLNGYLSHEALPTAQEVADSSTSPLTAEDVASQKPTTSTGPGIGNVAGKLESLNRKPDSVTYPFDLGIPDWVFWGIVLPWCLCVIATVIFCNFIYAEDDLGASEEEIAENHS